MNSIGDRINQLRVGAKLSKLALGNAIGVSDVTIGYWERDHTTPNRESLKKLATFLGVSENLIIDGHESSQVNNGYLNTGLRRIPILHLDEIITCYRSSFSNYILQNSFLEYIPADEFYSLDSFAFKVTGDSMEGHAGRNITGGSIATIDPNFDELNLQGRIVLALINNSHLTIKEYQVDSGVNYLIPWNKQYPACELTKDVCIIGCVKSVIMHFE